MNYWTIVGLYWSGVYFGPQNIHKKYEKAFIIMFTLPCAIQLLKYVLHRLATGEYEILSQN